MKITIVHRQDGTGCLLRMDDDVRVKLEALGSRALQMIQEQDPLLWSHAASTGFLKIMKQGACILRCIGVHGIIPLTDANAHRAFVTCCLLALRIDDHSRKDRKTLRLALIMLSECCTVQINRAIVPPYAWLPKAIKKASWPVRTYRRMLNHEPVSLAELLRLLEKLERHLTPSFVVIACDLRKTTEGLRKALAQTKVMRRKGLD